MRSQKPSQRAARGPRIARKRPRMRLAEQGRPDCRELAKAAGAGGQAGSEAAGGARRARRQHAQRQPNLQRQSERELDALRSQGARGAPGGTRQPATQPARTANSATRRPWHQELDRRGRNSTGAEGGSGGTRRSRTRARGTRRGEGNSTGHRTRQRASRPGRGNSAPRARAGELGQKLDLYFRLKVGARRERARDGDQTSTRPDSHESRRGGREGPMKPRALPAVAAGLPERGRAVPYPEADETGRRYPRPREAVKTRRVPSSGRAPANWATSAERGRAAAEPDNERGNPTARP